MTIPPIPLRLCTLDPTSHTLVMGVINTTPDSFSDGGKHLDAETAISAALEMLEAGADILDVGGESTRPGSSPVQAKEELARTEPVIRGIIRHRPDAVVSIDTRRRVVAEAAIRAGAQIINDVTAFRDDPSMVDLGRESDAALVAMHMLGTPKTMQIDIHYDSFPEDIYRFFEETIERLEGAGIVPEKIVIDPGIGFGKTFDQNLVLLNRLDYFRSLGRHLLVGPSRKAFLGKILGKSVAADRDLGTAAAVTAAVMKGASIIRAHNVPYAVEACKVADAILAERIEK